MSTTRGAQEFYEPCAGHESILKNAWIVSSESCFAKLMGRILYVVERRGRMDTTTLLIIVLVIVLLFGGGFYGRGRWW